jgi:hypothetical protein
MTAKKKVAEAPLEGTLLPSVELNKSLGIISSAASTIGQIEEEFKLLPTGGALVTMAGTIKGQEVLKVFLKQCTSTRTAIDNAHKDAKAPFLAASKAIDAKKAELTATVLTFEKPVKDGIAAYENQQARLAAEAQASELERLREENAKLKQTLVQAEVTPPFEDRQVVVTLRGREVYQAVRSIFGDAYNEVKTDANGATYLLEVVLRRKEIQDA